MGRVVLVGLAALIATVGCSGGESSSATAAAAAAAG